jgi:hypothetical protein
MTYLRPKPSRTASVTLDRSLKRRNRAQVVCEKRLECTQGFEARRVFQIFRQDDDDVRMMGPTLRRNGLRTGTKKCGGTEPEVEATRRALIGW